MNKWKFPLSRLCAGIAAAWMIALPAYAQELPLPPVQEEAVADAPLTEVEAAETMVAENAQAPQIPAQPADWTNSLMFEDASAAALQSLYRSYLARTQPDAVAGEGQIDGPASISLENLGATLTGEEPEQIHEEVLQFTLNSIAYNSPGDWTIWVNGVLYADDKAREGFLIDRSSLKVINIGPERVTYLWTPIPASFDQVRQRWEDKQRLEGVAVNTQRVRNEHVVFDEQDKTVTIGLRPNQTFVSQLMSVLEGAGEIRKQATTRAAAGGVEAMTAEEAVAAEAAAGAAPGLPAMPPAQPVTAVPHPLTPEEAAALSAQ